MALTAATMIVIGCAISAGIYFYLSPKLPSIESLKDVQLQTPLRVYSRDNKLIGEFGEMKRSPLEYVEIPPLMIKAILAAEDDRFFSHPGVDFQGLLRAAVHLIKTGKKGQGGSTITMQVARNFFLSKEKTYLRKFNEILLALKIEKQLSKEEILELYLNKIYLGKRAYGVAAAAQVYYDAKMAELSTAQMAMIAGLPKAPSRFNPVANPDRALIRRNYILRRMGQLDYISKETMANALSQADDAQLHDLSIETKAPHIAEMARIAALKKFGETTYTAGYKVITTIDSRLQTAADTALSRALVAYERRHGYRGAIGHIDLDTLQQTEQQQQRLKSLPSFGALTPALVLEVADQKISAILSSGESAEIAWQGLSWARRYISTDRRGPAPKKASDIATAGDIILLEKDTEQQWLLAQTPRVEGALISVDPEDGHVIALVGGYDFNKSRFNRVTQATRQPGSSFKPLIYSAALEKGYHPASLINDAPVVFEDSALESVWRPENYSGRFYGPTRLRQALIKSRNLVSIRLLRSIGISYTVNYISRFGFDRNKLPKNLSLALGSGAVTPWNMAQAYAVLASGGYRIPPYFIERIEAANGETIMQSKPTIVCPECIGELTSDGNSATIDDAAQFSVPDDVNIAERVISPQNAYLITSMMRDVIQRGTGVRAKALGRADIAGKTGTTNDQRDAWFAGFNSKVATICWVGFDKGMPLGARETGGRAALPMWVSYMREALKGTPENYLERPPGLTTVRIDPKTGLLAYAGQKNAIFETFRVENMPQQHAEPPQAQSQSSEGSSSNEGGTTEEQQLF